MSPAQEFIQKGLLDDITLGEAHVKSLPQQEAIPLMQEVLQMARDHENRLRRQNPDDERTVVAKEMRKSAEHLLMVADGSAIPPELDEGEVNEAVSLGRDPRATRRGPGGMSM